MNKGSNTELNEILKKALDMSGNKKMRAALCSFLKNNSHLSLKHSKRNLKTSE